MSAESSDKNICSECIRDATFSKWIEENGERGQCDFERSHRNKNVVVPLLKFAEHIDTYFRNNYGHGAVEPYFERDSDRPSYEQLGAPYMNILAEDLGCQEDVVDALAENLEDIEGFWPPDGGDAFYDKEINYEPLGAALKREQEEWEEYWFENQFSIPWQEFCDTVKYTRRFFKIQELLDKLFGTPDSYEKGVKVIYNIEAGQHLYRARLLDDNLNRAKLNSKPAAELDLKQS